MTIEEIERIKSTLYWSLYYFERNGGCSYYPKEIEQAREWLKNTLDEHEPKEREDAIKSLNNALQDLEE